MMKIRWTWSALVAAGLAALLTGGTVSAQAPKPLAEVDGEAITADEIEKPIAAQVAKLNEQIYNLKRQRLEAAIRQKLLEKEAARRGLTVPKLLDAEVTSRVGLVTEEEVEAFLEANRGRLGSDETAAREQARNRLQSQKLGTAREAYVTALRNKAKITMNLAPPPVVRIDVSTDGAPAKGPAQAPVTIVEFSDFHCPFCKRVLPTLDSITQKYGNRIRLVFRDYPIEQLHPGASRAHVAARCANEQGKFWPFHDLLFARAPRTSDDDMKGMAKQVGMDAAAFDACLASGKYDAAVRRDMDEGQRAGVTGTPAFFINGRLVSGAQPLEAFTQLIDDELARASAKR
jgi:protein-disulfide isomerase